MGVINTLRNKAGKYVTFAIGFAIIAFIVSDWMSSNSSFIQGGDDVGEIAGETISREDYQNAINYRKVFYDVYYRRQPSDREMDGVRNQAWEYLITETAYKKEFEKLGITVTGDEVWDLVQGKNIDPSIRQLFVNPQTQEFDRTQLISFLQQVSQLEDGNRAKRDWQFIERELTPARTRIKYENLLNKTDYVTEAEAEEEYALQNNVAEVDYLYIPYYSISDSAAQVTDGMLRDYYNKHKEEYKTEHTRDVSYVSFPIVASSEDSTYFKQELNDLKATFKTSKEDSVFAKINTDGDSFYGIYNPGTLPAVLQGNITNLTAGDVRGAYLEGNFYKLYKVSSIEEDTVYSAKASHILFRWENETDEAKAEAKKKANDVLAEIRNGADFAEKAKEHGTDGTASRGGDLGWFTQGKKMVKEFDEAVFAKEGAGLINKLVETQFGYHIVEVTDAKTKTIYKVATIEREIAASQATRDEAYRKSDYFSGTNEGMDDFKANAEKESLQILEGEKIGANDNRIGALANAREVVQWLFREASEDKISDVFELDDAYVVAIMTGEQEKGYADLAEVKDQITVKVKNELKAEQIIKKIGDPKGGLNEIASGYGNDAKVHSSSDLKLTSSSLPSVGFDPSAVGKAFGLGKGEKTAPFAGENGVLIIEMKNLTNAPEVADYTTYKNQVQQRLSGKTRFNIDQAIKEFSSIEDKRYRFY